MNLPDRIRLIISENNLKQKEFAKSISVTESYISKLIRGESGLSNSTATLIAEKYGYSINWVVDGIEPKMNQQIGTKDLSPIQRKIISDIEQMDEADLSIVKAFINSLEEYKKSFSINKDLRTNNKEIDTIDVELVARDPKGPYKEKISKEKLQLAVNYNLKTNDNDSDLF